jgi:hypothetical protein
MTQALYAHMNNKRKKRNDQEKKKFLFVGFENSIEKKKKNLIF